MQKIILITLLSLTNINVYSQIRYVDSTLIEWDSSNKIMWGDFRAKIDTTSHYKAECVTLLKCIFFLKGDSLFCNIKAFFNPKKSWRKYVDLDNCYDLNHEQLHFDITEIFARKIRQVIISNNLNEETIQKIYNENAKACYEFQDLYDKETNHSLNKVAQDTWNRKTNGFLLSLDQYKEQNIFIKNPYCKPCWK